MNRPVLAAAFLLASCAAHGAETPPSTLTTVQGSCKVVNPKPAQGESVSWSGACVDGHAHGSGILEWQVGGKVTTRYEGDMQRGVLEGKGYLKLADGTEYDGGFREGRYHGKGTRLDIDGRYEGDWNNGKRDGNGTMKFALGGLYEGGWKDDKYHGAARVRYAGGQAADARFADGVLEGEPAAAALKAVYTLKSQNPEYGTRMAAVLAGPSTVPYTKSYADMSADEKRAVRDHYPMLAKDDEPPFPLNGTGGIYKWLAKARDEHQFDNGDLTLHVKVGSDGVPLTVAVYNSPDPWLQKFAAAVVMKERFKPALCGGKPCEMLFPMRIIFTSG